MLSALFFETAAGENDLKWLVQFCMWIARALVLLVFCGFGIYKAVKGQGEENAQEKNEGLQMIGLGAFIFAGTFAIEKALN